MQHNFTRGPIRKSLILFSLPLIAGNLLQQFYNIADTWIVGRFLGSQALAAVGSAFSLMILLNSLVLGLCMGSSVVFSQLWGEQRKEEMKRAMVNAFVLIFAVSTVLTLLSYLLLPQITLWMQIPEEVSAAFKGYLEIIFAGILFTFLYNYFAAVLRSVGNSMIPLVFLILSTISNILLDFLFVLGFHQGVQGAALATVISQAFSAVGICLYTLIRDPQLKPSRIHFRMDTVLLKRISSVSVLTSIQQSIMNLGILMVQSLVNSFGISAMAAFAAGVKIDSFAYSPAQDFANGFSTFVAQNAGAGKYDRVRQGFRQACLLSFVFCLTVSILVILFAHPLLSLFIDPLQSEIMEIGIQYLRIEGLFYVGIGLLFLLYSTYRGLEKAGMSIVLTIVSLGLRVILSYTFAPVWGLWVIFVSIPVGWFVADLIGLAGLAFQKQFNNKA